MQDSIHFTHEQEASIPHVGITNEERARGYLLLKHNEEMGEAGLSVISEIERISILAPGITEDRWRARAVWVQ